MTLGRAEDSYLATLGGAEQASTMLRRREPRPDRVRALSRADVERLLTRKDISIRERTLRRMLYETTARLAEVLASVTRRASAGSPG